MSIADLAHRLEAVRAGAFDPGAMREARKQGFTGRTIEQARDWARHKLDNTIQSASKES